VSLFSTNTVNRVSTNFVFYCILHEILILHSEYCCFLLMPQYTELEVIKKE
jgi:hypothetical protein